MASTPFMQERMETLRPTDKLFLKCAYERPSRSYTPPGPNGKRVGNRLRHMGLAYQDGNNYHLSITGKEMARILASKGWPGARKK